MESQAQNTATPQNNPLWDRIVEVLGTKKPGEIAKQLELSPSSVSDWKHQRTKPSLSILEQIAFYGETTVDYLLNGDLSKRFSEGDDSYFDKWFLPSDYRPKLEKIAEIKQLSVSEVVREFLIESIDRFFANDDIAHTIRKIVREELNKQNSINKNEVILLDEEIVKHPDNLTDETRNALRLFFTQVMSEPKTNIKKTQNVIGIEVPHLGKIGGVPEESDIQFKTHTKQEKKVG